MSNNSIWSIDWTLLGATALDQRGPGSTGNEGVYRIPRSSSNAGALQSDCSVSYPRYYWEESYLSAEMQSVYSPLYSRGTTQKSRLMHNRYKKSRVPSTFPHDGAASAKSWTRSSEASVTWEGWLLGTGDSANDTNDWLVFIFIRPPNG